VRNHAARLGVNSKRVGVMGFSAGGHVAASLSQLWNYTPQLPDIADQQWLGNAKPDFSIFIYPVMSMQPPYMHKGSRRGLLGETPDKVTVARYSFDHDLRKDSPPTLLIHSSADNAVPAENSVAYWQALREHKLNAELLIYQQGNHGHGLRVKNIPIAQWPLRVEQWLQSFGVLPNV